MTVTLEWVQMPNEVYFCTICKNGVPLSEPTRYLLSYVHPDYGSTHTVRTYGQWLLPFFKWLDRQQMALSDLTRMDLERFRTDLTLVNASSGPLLQKGADSAPSTIYYAVAAAARFIIWAMGYSDTEPLLHYGAHRGNASRRFLLPRLVGVDLTSLLDIAPDPKPILTRYLTQDQLDRCRRWIMDTYSFNTHLQIRNRALFETLWDGALRRGSLLALQTTNIDWLNRTLLVSFDEKDYREAWFTKSRNFRTAKTGEYLVIIADQTLQWLDRYRQEARPVEAIRLNHSLFFCEYRGVDHGYPLSLETLQYFFKSMSQPEDQGGTGIHVTPHLLRHTWATMALNDGLPPEVIQHQLGHSSILTTEKYSRVAPEKRRQEMKQWRENHPERYLGAE